MKKVVYLVVIFVLLMSGCAPTRAGCGDGKCASPENADNCPQDCAIPATSADEADAPSNNSGGYDLSKSVEMTVTTYTTEQSGYGMTVTGVVKFDLDFPKAGGAASLAMGSVEITDYAWEEIPGCNAKIPDDLVGATQSISFTSIEYTPGGFMIFNGPIQYEAKNYEVVLDCVNSSTPVTEQPFYKVFGVFNDLMKTLSFKPEDGFNNTVKWNMNDAFTSNIVIVVK